MRYTELRELFCGVTILPRLTARNLGTLVLARLDRVEVSYHALAKREMPGKRKRGRSETSQSQIPSMDLYASPNSNLMLITLKALKMENLSQSARSQQQN